MSYLVIPLLFIAMLAPTPGPPTDALADFSRFSRELNKEISFVDLDGRVHDGILAAATEDDVTVRFGSGMRSFPRAEIASAERMRDSSLDGFVKGALFGAVGGLLSIEGYGSGANKAAGFVGAVAVYGGIGYLLDAAQTHRETIYRAPAGTTAAITTPANSVLKPALQIKWRF